MVRAQNSSKFSALVSAFVVCASFFACNAFADGLRLNARNVALGNGHGAVCISDKIGNLECVEYGVYDPPDSNHDQSNALVRDFRAMPYAIETDANGNLTEKSVQEIVNVFADYYGIDKVDVSHFPEAMDLAGAKAKIAQINGKIDEGEKYNLFYRNCGEMAGKILQAAGAKDIVFGIIPNIVSQKERAKLSTKANGKTWTGVWKRQNGNAWQFGVN